MTGPEWLAVAGLGALGALLRFLLSAWVTHYRRALMIVVVNTVGAFAAGWGLAADWGMWGTLLAAGLWGSLTTFSTLAVDVVEWSTPRGHRPVPYGPGSFRPGSFHSGRLRTGLTLLLLHLVGGVAGVWSGMALAGLV